MQHVHEKYDIGVIVGRFQVHELHEAHRELVSHVCAAHEKVIIVLGLAPLPVSTNNPLDFEARKQMLLAEFPDVIVVYAKDRHDDKLWSDKLDELVNDLRGPGQSVVLYGGRDSFISHYTGNFATQELMQAEFRSGTAVRRSIARSKTRATADFRAGVIWASQGRFPTSYTTVDVAIINENTNQILLGRKKNEQEWRFIGGFADPKSPSFEADAKREVQEETGLEVGTPKYIGSMVIDDWRYRNEPDGIKTMLFQAEYLHGRAQGADDIEDVRWFDLQKGGFGRETFQTNGNGADWRTIMPAHRPLMAMLLANRKEQ